MQVLEDDRLWKTERSLWATVILKGMFIQEDGQKTGDVQESGVSSETVEF